MKKYILVGALCALFGGTTLVTAPEARWTTDYWVIDGPDYREVTRGRFATLKSSCSRVLLRTYPEKRMHSYQCEL